MTRPVLRTRLCDILDIEYPVILAGMGGVATAELVAAVSEAGGLGIVGAASMPPDEIERQVRRIRDLTSKPFGVDVLLPSGVAAPQAAPKPEAAPAGAPPAAPKRPLEYLPQPYQQFVHNAEKEFGLPERGADQDWSQGMRRLGAGGFSKSQVDAILELKVPVFAAGLGNPAPYVEAFHAQGAKVIGLVGNVKNARRLNDGGTDVIVAQGTEAGGHTGRIGTMALLPQVVDAVAPTPVCAAGGIGDGRGIAGALAMGADGVWVGTAFLVSREATWPDVLKQRILAATEEDTRVTRLYSGKTMRNINNPLIEYWESQKLDALPMGAQGIVSGEIMAGARQADRLELLMNPAGQISGMLHESRNARDIFEEMVREAAEILADGLARRVKASL
ncbi:MAG TPA: nitronate monooxygenase [Dehalococcoidia bacterium]|nr:nitronate monooxygenase [Dehalococcoidia bacterium]